MMSQNILSMSLRNKRIKESIRRKKELMNNDLNCVVDYSLDHRRGPTITQCKPKIGRVRNMSKQTVDKNSSYVSDKAVSRKENKIYGSNTSRSSKFGRVSISDGLAAVKGIH